jgi:hypothetical protein
MEINIAGIDKAKLLHELWNEGRPAAFYTLARKTQLEWSDTAAVEAVKGSIDYFRGRAIKADLSGDTVDPTIYDDYTEIGTFARVVAKLRTPPIK